MVVITAHMFDAHGIYEMGRVVTSDASCARLSIARRFLRNDL